MKLGDLVKITNARSASIIRRLETGAPLSGNAGEFGVIVGDCDTMSLWGLDVGWKYFAVLMADAKVYGVNGKFLEHGMQCEKLPVSD